MRLEISFLLLWNRRSAFLQYCTLLFQKLDCFDCPSDMVGQIWHVPTVQVDMCVVMYNVHTCHRHRSWPCGSTGPVPEVAASSATAQEKIFQNLTHQKFMEFILSKKFWKRFFSGVEKISSCLGSGHAPRATSQIPGTDGASLQVDTMV